LRDGKRVVEIKDEAVEGHRVVKSSRHKVIS